MTNNKPTPQDSSEAELDEILDKVLLIWKQDYPKNRPDGGLFMDEYFKRLDKAKVEAKQALFDWSRNLGVDDGQ